MLPLPHPTRPSKLLLPVALLLWLSALPCGAAGIGGQDVEVAHLLDADGNAHEPCLAIASDGTAFVVMDFHDEATDRSDLLVYRSLNGGKTWDAWGPPLQVDQGTLPIPPPIAFDAAIAPGSPEQLVIACEDDYLGFTVVDVERADIDDATPSWQSSRLDVRSLLHLDPHISCVEGLAGGPAQIAVILSNGDPSGAGAQYIHYALSDDGGAVWGASVTLASIGSGTYTTDVALDADGVVQAVWTYAYPGGDAEFYHCRATDGGASAGDWSSPVLLRDGGLVASTTVSVAASPVSGGVIATVSEYDVPAHTYIYISTDAGLTWPNPPKSFDQKAEAVAVWGDAGAAVGVSDHITGDRYMVLRPQGNLLELWTPHEMLSGLSITGDAWGGPAADPSRGGALAMVGLLPNLQGTGTSPWFDAEWRADAGFGVPQFEPGFDIGTGNITSALGTADLDGDGDREVVFTAGNPHRVVRFDLESMTATTLKTTAATSATSAPAMIDVDGDGTIEVFVGVDTGRVVGVHEDGTYVTGFPADTGSASPVWASCGQVTGTAAGEVAAATGRSILVYGPTGGVAAGFPYTAVLARGNVVGRVAIGDVEGDGDAELVAAFQHGVLVLSGGGVLEEAMLLSGPDISAGVSLADLDDDGDLEIAVPRANGSVALLHHDGSTWGAAWPWNTGTGEPIGSVAIADFFGDSRKELVFAALSGEVFAVDLDGVQPTGWAFTVGAHVEDAPEPIVSGLGAFGKQIALGDLDDIGYVRWPLAPQAGWPRSFYGEIEHAPAAADLDGDGNVELVLPAGGRLWVLDMDVAAGAAITNWPMAGAGSTRSGCRECEIDLATGVANPPGAGAMQATGALHAGEPNPFANSTLLRYEAPAAGGRVRIGVYNIAGRLVRSLVDQQQAGGSHAVRWDGRDATGRAVAAGIYLVRMSTGRAEHRARLVRLQ